MKCNDVRAFFSEVASKSVTTKIPQSDLDFFITNEYIALMKKEEYDQALAEVANLTQLNEEIQKDANEKRNAEAVLKEYEKKTHSIMFHLEGREKKETDLAREQAGKSNVLKVRTDLAAEESKLNELIQKKSRMDRMVPYNGYYVSLTGLGIITLTDLNVRNYRVSDWEFSDFVAETQEMFGELRVIAERGGFFVSTLRTEVPIEEPSQMWNVSIGLAKLQGDQNQIAQRYLLAMKILKHSDSTNENKMMAAEIMTAFRMDPSQPSSNDDLQELSHTMADLEKELRHQAKVPEELSVGIAAMMMFRKRYDGTYPIDTFVEFSKITLSSDAAAILAVMNEPLNQLADKFRAYRGLFGSWGYGLSEDSELASAYLSVSDLAPDDVRTKITILIDALKNYLEYPLVAAAILASIPTLEANETLNLMEKASKLLSYFAPDLERSELVSLSVMMIHGIQNELVKKLDSTATIVNIPSQLVYPPSAIFFMYRAPLIIAHSSYYSKFSRIEGFHPAHVHGVGGFMG
jgi:hypothetical protein